MSRSSFRGVWKIYVRLENFIIRKIFNCFSWVKNVFSNIAKEAAFLVRIFHVFIYGHAPNWSIGVTRKAGWSVPRWKYTRKIIFHNIIVFFIFGSSRSLYCHVPPWGNTVMITASLVYFRSYVQWHNFFQDFQDIFKSFKIFMKCLRFSFFFSWNILENIGKKFRWTCMYFSG